MELVVDAALNHHSLPLFSALHANGFFQMASEREGGSGGGGGSSSSGSGSSSSGSSESSSSSETKTEGEEGKKEEKN